LANVTPVVAGERSSKRGSGFFVSPHAHSANTTKQQVPGLRSLGRQVSGEVTGMEIP